MEPHPYEIIERQSRPVQTISSLPDAVAHTLAPAAIGCAVGMIAGRSMQRAAGGFAGALFALGALAVAPALFEIVDRISRDPDNRFGRARQMDAIRHGGMPLPGGGQGGGLTEE